MAIDHASAIEKLGLKNPSAMLIAGEICQAATGEHFESIDPATGTALQRVPLARQPDVDRALQAARAAFDGGPWRGWGASKRARALNKLADLCSERASELAMLESLDVGMPRQFAKRLSVAALSKNLRYYASWADKGYGQVVPEAGAKVLDYTLREPIGVILALIPWNTPLLFVASKLGPALASGNVVILKPSEVAPLSALKVATLIEEAGFPPGVVQVLSGDAETGKLLVEHPGVDKISFTGGGDIARKVLSSAARGLKPSMLELGGKSANLIFEDADLGKANMLSTFGVFGLGGQACAAGSRWLVQRSVHDEVVKRVKAGARTLVMGDPLAPMTMLGPLCSQAHRDRVLTHIENARSDGANLVQALEPPAGCDGGAFLGPHIFTDVTPEMRLFREEVFGPVLAITPFDTEEEAVALANDSNHGLAGAVWTRDIGRAHRVAHAIRAGTIWVNSYGSLPSAAPFGGYGQSGWGREGGHEALQEYTQVKNVLVELG